MKILQVVAALTAGGVETLLHSYYEEMDREQFHCDVACFSHYHGVYRKKYEELCERTGTRMELLPPGFLAEATGKPGAAMAVKEGSFSEQMISCL